MKYSLFRIGFLEFLTLIFVWGKIVGKVDWSWWIVFSPVLAPLAIALLVVILVVIYLIGYAICAIIFNKE